MLSNPELAFCIYQNHKEKHCVDLVNILAMIDNGIQKNLSALLYDKWLFYGLICFVNYF